MCFKLKIISVLNNFDSKYQIFTNLCCFKPKIINTPEILLQKIKFLPKFCYFELKVASTHRNFTFKCYFISKNYQCITHFYSQKLNFYPNFVISSQKLSMHCEILPSKDILNQNYQCTTYFSSKNHISGSKNLPMLVQDLYHGAALEREFVLLVRNVVVEGFTDLRHRIPIHFHGFTCCPPAHHDARRRTVKRGITWRL